MRKNADTSGIVEFTNNYKGYERLEKVKYTDRDGNSWL